ncbi:ABC transporter substrate-binding protein [Pelagibacterium montanilacus]|uniref:ABC transporter substrate-binding protein n=1 Tax=Pelagibacterium montanilacus TaxID=2185280 RepID=UPI000F8F0B21|nr:ABC transporter substrate-binding protein [Pelagibacterium montanilacus]
MTLSNPFRRALQASCATALVLSLGLAGPAMAQDYSQAPELDEAVSAGDLPDIADRLPSEPEIVEPLDAVGTYGGTIRSALRGDQDHNGILLLVGAQGLVRWAPDFSGVVPNVAESWNVNEDNTEFTFHLREGMRWSDGETFSADDIVFAAELLADTEFMSNMPSRYVLADEPMEVEKVDDATVTVRFAAPYRNFLEELAKPLGQHLVLYARHYCEQFHPDYADPDALAAELEAAGTDSWAQLMRTKCADIELPTRWGNVDRPTLDPWVIEQPYTGGATQVTLTRNPYFWQVDTEGQQLPYADSLRFSIIADIESILLSTINGQFDYQVRHIFPISNRPVLFDNTEQGNFEIMDLTPLDSNFLGLYLNHSTDNAELRELFANRDFKAALSLGIDRVEVDEIIQLGQGAPWQIGPFEETKFYNEALGTQFTAHDVEEANRLLDDLGLTERDGDGFRLFENGERLSINAIVTIAKPTDVESLEIIREQWRDIGVELVISTSERSLFYERAQTNAYDISADTVPGAVNPTLDMRALAAVHPLESRMSIPWVNWYLSGGEGGEEPSENMKQRLELIDQLPTASSDEEADEIVAEVLSLAAEAFEVIGVSKRAPALGIRASNLGNVYEQMPYGWDYGTPGPALPQTWYFQ